ncbi:hypothetical protein OGAPHI_004721 [Ogataea philodendri]|uniref:Ribophorin II C-terminal domain-containing protein n=1 Tax=Ogataea philodendri TaxID=1378263 RepID=A0A9P8P2I2_9ASCO|nr:uncharacterized protein OGAPHI_004721 [Ogataea philodendri]KAH3664007.1 hypothetical protein OGAPHI_004721 [Ogataea philodendri]
MLSFAFLLLCVPAWTLELVNVALTVDGIAGLPDAGAIALDAESKRIELEFDMTVGGNPVSSPPQQVSVVLTGDGVDSYHYPTVKGAEAKLTVPVAKLSPFIKQSPEIVVSVLTGDPDTEKNYFEPVGKLQAGLSARSRPARFGAKEEIVHQFGGLPKHVNPVISIIFIGGVVALTVGLFAGWTGVKAVNFDNLGKLPAGFTVQFLATLALIELIFVDYFLEASIFTTIFRTFVVGVVSVYLGSKVLRALHGLREAGKR